MFTVAGALRLCDVGYQALYQDLDLLAPISVVSCGHSYYSVLRPEQRMRWDDKMIKLDQAQAPMCPSTSLGSPRETKGLLRRAMLMNDRNPNVVR